MESYRTDYDRWILLALRDRPPEDVVPGHRWRLVTPRERGAPITAEVIAVRILHGDPLPARVRPTHHAICPATEAEWEAEQEAEGS